MARFILQVERPDSLLGVLRSKGFSSRQAKRLLDCKCVWVGNELVWMGKHHVQRGSRLVYFDDPLHTMPRDPDILFEDAHLTVFNKRPYIAVTGKNALEGHLRDRRKETGLRAVHRLDKETSGCVVFARTPEAQAGMLRHFRERAVEKDYETIVKGLCSWPERRFSTRLDGREARTICRPSTRSRKRTLLDVRIETGRKHQIRRHLAEAGHPVLGDKEYAETDGAVARQMLHAKRIAFAHPILGTTVECIAPRPADFAAAVQSFK